MPASAPPRGVMTNEASDTITNPTARRVATRYDIAAAVFGSMDSEAAFPRTIQIPHENIVSEPNTTAESISGIPIDASSPETVTHLVCGDSDQGSENNHQRPTRAARVSPEYCSRQRLLDRNSVDQF